MTNQGINATDHHVRRNDDSRKIAAALERLSADYRAAFRRYWSRRDESGLAAAYELGRHAVIAGVGVLDLVQVHHATLLEEFRQIDDMDRVAELADTASSFFTEALGPYEMMHQGFQEHHQNATGLLHASNGDERP